MAEATLIAVVVGFIGIAVTIIMGKQSTDKRFDKVDARFDKVDARLYDINGRVSTIEGSLRRDPAALEPVK